MRLSGLLVAFATLSSLFVGTSASCTTVKCLTKAVNTSKTTVLDLRTTLKETLSSQRVTNVKLAKYVKAKTNKHMISVLTRRSKTIATKVRTVKQSLGKAKKVLAARQKALKIARQQAATKPTSTPVKTATAPAATKTTKPATTFTSNKRGLGYNDAALTLAFSNKKAISWVYNWGNAESNKLGAGVSFIPMLWGRDATGWQKAAQTAVKNGAKFLLGFNEPDLAEQSNISVDDAAKLWKKNMEPFHSDSVTLVSPAITNGGAPMGVAWMQAFIKACTGCHIGAVAMHWYDRADNVAYFENYLTEAAKTFDRPIWLTEFAGSGTVAEQQTFLKTVLPWMEKQSFIERYAAFGDFVGTFVNADGSLTALGNTYATA